MRPLPEDPGPPEQTLETIQIKDGRIAVYDASADIPTDACIAGYSVEVEE